MGSTNSTQVQMITDMLRKQIVTSNFRKYDKDKFDPEKITFSPSSIGNCIRAIVYGMIKEQPLVKDARIYAIMDNGTGFHDRMEKLFEKTGTLVSGELIINDKTLTSNPLRVSGRSDVVIKNILPHTSSNNIITLYQLKDKGLPTECPEKVYEGPDNDVIIIELKSASSYKFNNKLINKPLQEHTDQVLIYMYLTGIKIGCIFYENKDNQEWKSFLVEYDQERINYLIDKIQRSLYYARNNIIPDREYDEYDLSCTFCDYKHICRPENYNNLPELDI
jgi:CRISPR/Cas system-associated exonuclease Cas4 (RecB family)